MGTRALLAAAVLLPSLLHAQLQRRDTSAIPRDLALALIAMNNYGMSEPTIIVGRLPDPSVAALVPPGARVLGGISFSSRRGMAGANHTTVLSMKETPDSALNVLEATFERLGWRRPPMPGGSDDRGGFAVAVPVGGFGYGGGSRGLMYCSDSAFANATASPAGDVSVIRLMVNSEALGLCDSRRTQMPRRIELLQLPTLRPPPGTSTIGGMGSSGGMDSRESTTQLGSRISAAEMVAHFAPQLEEQGWKIVTRVNEADVSTLTARKSAENGDTLHLLLVDYRFDLRSHHASVRVWNPAARQGW